MRRLQRVSCWARRHLIYESNTLTMCSPVPSGVLVSATAGDARTRMGGGGRRDILIMMRAIEVELYSITSSQKLVWLFMSIN